jgi:hypothetical protein
MNVTEAWSAVQSEIKAVGKDGRNQQQSYNFRGIDGVMNAVGPALRKHGVTITPRLHHRESSSVEVGKNRTLMAHVVVEVDYIVRGPDGDTWETPGRTPGEAMDSGDKATSKAMSVAYRTFLIQALTLPTHDIDPDAESYERSPADPLAGLKHAVIAEANRHGIKDVQTLSAHFAEVMSGAVLADADEQGLRGYLETLKGMGA